METIKQEKSDRTYTVDSRRNMKKKVLMTIRKMDATKKFVGVSVSLTNKLIVYVCI